MASCELSEFKLNWKNVLAIPALSFYTLVSSLKSTQLRGVLEGGLLFCCMKKY